MLLRDTNRLPIVPIIIGPTTSGKTGLAVTLAHALAGEVISADSRQVYKHTVIGTDQISEAQKRGIPHHLLSTVEPDTIYTAHNFARDATHAIEDCISRNVTPIITGGTGFYVDVLTGRVRTEGENADPLLRAELSQLSTEELQARLLQLSSAKVAAMQHDGEFQNPRRLVRAIEIALPKPSAIPASTIEPLIETLPYRFITTGLTADRETLRASINSRARTQLSSGLLEETQSLLSLHNVTPERLRELGFEYAAAYKIITGELTHEKGLEYLTTKCYQYAKRQITYWKKREDIEWFSAKSPTIVEDILGVIK